MGIWLKPRNVKWGDDHERMALEIHEMAWPYCANPDGSFNRSKTTRWAIEMWHMALSTPGIMEKLGLLLQGLQCARYVSTQQAPSEERPGLMRMAQRGHEGDRARRTGTDSNSYRVTAMGVWVDACHLDRKDRYAWGAPFSRSLRGMVA